MRHSYCDLIILTVEHRKFEENKTNDEGYTKHDCAMCPRHNSHHNISRNYQYNKHNNNNNNNISTYTGLRRRRLYCNTRRYIHSKIIGICASGNEYGRAWIHQNHIWHRNTGVHIYLRAVNILKKMKFKKNTLGGYPHTPLVAAGELRTLT